MNMLSKVVNLSVATVLKTFDTKSRDFPIYAMAWTIALTSTFAVVYFNYHGGY